MKKEFIKSIFIFFAILILIYRQWFSFQMLSGGDWSYKYAATIKEFTLHPYVWHETFFSGLGSNISFILGIETYFLSTASLIHNVLGFDWVLIERLVWFWPFLIISVFSSYYLFKKLFQTNLHYWRHLFIYSTLTF